MERIDLDIMADAILEAPGWARVGITAPSANQPALSPMSRNVRR